MESQRLMLTATQMALEVVIQMAMRMLDLSEIQMVLYLKTWLVMLMAIPMVHLMALTKKPRHNPPHLHRARLHPVQPL